MIQLSNPDSSHEDIRVKPVLEYPFIAPSVKASLVVEFQRKHFRSASASLALLSEGVGTGSKAGDRKSVALR